jgi:CheY-like chemotaxis protein
MAPASGETTILVVEDNAAVRTIAVRLVKQLGYAVVEAENAGEALKLLATDRRVDLLFTDIVMPGAMTGDALARQAQALRPGLRVLLTTGFAEGPLRNRAQPVDVTGFSMLRKPYRKPELERRLQEVLEGP